MKSFLTFFLFFTVQAFPDLAQPTQPHRIEIPVRSNMAEGAIFPLPDSSVLTLIYDPQLKRTATEQFTLYKFDHALELSWQKNLEIPKGSHFFKGLIEKNTAYLLFDTPKRSEFVLVRVNLPAQRYVVSKHVLPAGITILPEDLKVLQNVLFVSGKQNEQLLFLRLDPSEKEFTILPVILSHSAALSDFFTDSVSNTVELLLAENNFKVSRLQLKRFSRAGELLSTNFLLSRRDYNFLAGQLTADSSHKMIAGTYGQRDLRYAQGFFTTFLQNNPRQPANYYDFTTFSHYFDYLNPKRKNRLREKVDRFRETHKTYYLRRRMLLHALQPYLDGYLLVGEMYYPHYQHEGNSHFFDGYEFLQTIVCAFDKDGNLRWENSFPIRNQRFYDLQETVTVGVFGNRVMLTYLDEGTIRYKDFYGSETTPNDKQVDILPAEAGAKITNTSSESIIHWYKANFLLSGIHSVRGSAGSRQDFYLNKIAF